MKKYGYKHLSAGDLLREEVNVQPCRPGPCCMLSKHLREISGVESRSFLHGCMRLTLGSSKHLPADPGFDNSERCVV